MENIIMNKKIKRNIGIIFLTVILSLNLFAANIFASSTYDQKTIKSIQSILNMWGYNCGTPDGVMGKNTTDAIKKYQKDQELAETGDITGELLDAMLSGIPLTTLNERYNEAVTYWNKLSDKTDSKTLNYSNFTKDEVEYCLNDSMEILFGKSSDMENMVQTAIISSDSHFDTATCLVEIYVLVYAFDINLESPIDAQDVVGNILDASDFTYEDGGIQFNNFSAQGVGLSIYMKYDVD